MRLLAGAAVIGALSFVADCGGRQSVVISGRPHAATIRCLTAADRPAVLTDAEVHAATDPTDASHAIAAWQALGGPAGIIQAAASFDGGATWSDPAPVPISACAGGPGGARRASDPWVAIGSQGRAYVAAIGWAEGDGNGGDEFSSLVVVASADGGRSWGGPVVVTVAAGGISFDNVSVGVDPARDHAVYLASTRYEAVEVPGGRRTSAGRIGFARSRDGGATWTPVTPVSPLVPGGRISAPQVLVEPATGRVMVFYYRSGPESALFGMQYSDDGGDTWSAEQVVAPAVAAVQTVAQMAGRESYPLAGDILQAAAGRREGVLHVAYADGRRSPDERLGVSLVSSVDRGLTWSPPVSVSRDSAVTAWLPALAVDAEGQVGVGYVTSDLAKPLAERTLSYHLAGFRPAAGRMVEASNRVLDQGPMIWPGDYHAVLATPAGMRLVTVRAADPATATNPTDVVVR